MNKLLKILFDQFGGTLSITRKSSGTIITAAGFNTNYDEIEAVVNGAIEAANIAADAVGKSELNVDVVRESYGLAQHTDGSIYVSLHATPGIELSGGKLRVNAYGLINLTSDGVEWGDAGDVLYSSRAAAPDGFTDVTATYADKYVRIGSTGLATGGNTTHNHGAATGSTTLTAAQSGLPAHVHTLPNVHHSGNLGSSDYQTSDGGSPGAAVNDTGSVTATAAASGHTHVISSADNDPAYVDVKMFTKD